MANPSAIKKSVDFEGVTYTVGEIRRVAAATALEAIKDGTAVAESFILSGSGDIGGSATSGQLFVTASMAVTSSISSDFAIANSNYNVVCYKK